MDIFGTIKNLFRKTEQPMPITIQPEPTPIVVEKKRLPKTLMSEYRQDFTKYDDFNTSSASKEGTSTS
jgi:hypothetical protein